MIILFCSLINKFIYSHLSETHFKRVVRQQPYLKILVDFFAVDFDKEKLWYLSAVIGDGAVRLFVVIHYCLYLCVW